MRPGSVAATRHARSGRPGLPGYAWFSSWFMIASADVGVRGVVLPAEWLSAVQRPLMIRTAYRRLEPTRADHQTADAVS
jgi:hypothetical protein